jgi:DNA-binding response OmpR family regulator
MSLQQHVVLVIDDEESIRKLISFILKKEGMVVFEAADGNQGLTIAAEHRPDLIITDLLMPEKEGIETIREIRSLFPACVIIAMSGGPNSESYLSMATCFGAHRMIQKPFNRKVLLDAVSESIQQIESATIETLPHNSTVSESFRKEY